MAWPRVGFRPFDDNGAIQACGIGAVGFKRADSVKWRGTRRDGSRFLMRGPFLFGARDGAFVWLRCYLEPVDEPAIAEARR